MLKNSRVINFGESVILGKVKICVEVRPSLKKPSLKKPSLKKPSVKKRSLKKPSLKMPSLNSSSVKFLKSLKEFSGLF